MFDINKIISDARKLGIIVNTDVPNEKKGLFYADENSNLNKWDYKSEFNHQDDIGNYLENLEILVSKINKNKFYENDNYKQEISGEYSDLVGAA